MSEEDFSLFHQMYLQDCAEFISWEGSLNGIKIEEMEHQIKLFLDVDEHGQELLMRLEFCYDQKTAYGFERHGDCLLSPNASAIEQFLSHWVAFVDDRHFAHVQPNVDWGQMSEELPQLLSPYCEIYVSEQLRKAAKPKQLSMNIGVRVENQLLTLDFDLDGMEMSELQNVLKKSLKLLLGTGIVLLSIGVLFAGVLSGLFVGYDAQLYAMTVRGLRFYAVSFLLSGFNIFGSSFFTALNNGMVSAAISFLRTVVFEVAAVLILPLFFGLDGVWCAITVAELASILITIGAFSALRKRYQYL